MLLDCLNASAALVILVGGAGFEAINAIDEIVLPKPISSDNIPPIVLT